MRTNITLGTSFIYRGWIGHISKHWSGNKFKVSITSISRSPIEYEFTVSPHWFVNEDWEKAGQLAQQYIDEIMVMHQPSNLQI